MPDGGNGGDGGDSGNGGGGSRAAKNAIYEKLGKYKYSSNKKRGKRRGKCK